MAKEMFDMKLIGTPMFRHKEDLKVEQAKKQEELFESRKPKSNYEAVAGNDTKSHVFNRTHIMTLFNISYITF